MHGQKNIKPEGVCAFPYSINGNGLCITEKCSKLPIVQHNLRISCAEYVKSVCKLCLFEYTITLNIKS